MKTCQQCGLFPAYLYEKTEKAVFYCATHLFEALQRDIENYEGKLYALSPDVGNHTDEYAYLFIPVDMLTSVKKEDVTTRQILNILDSINGICEQCEKPAQTAYVPAHFVRWRTLARGYRFQKKPPFLRRYTQETPDIECKNYPLRMLCKTCTATALINDMKATLENYLHNGIQTPKNSNGILMPHIP